jgi:mono/diheme cytochrome c family protein
MTELEREDLGAWVAQGARTEGAPEGHFTAPAAPEPAVDWQAAGGPPEQAKALFAARCALCHGPTGAGDGVASAGLTPKPRNYHDTAWQASVTDEALRTVIKEGGAAVGKSAVMPPNPDLVDKPDVVDELVKLVRAFGATDTR